MVGRYLLIFVLGVIGILMAAPLILTLFTSLKPTTELVNPAWYPPLEITFEHYVRVWTEGGFSRYFLNTLIISVVDAIVMIFIASLAAYGLVFLNFYCGRTSHKIRGWGFWVCFFFSADFTLFVFTLWRGICTDPENALFPIGLY